MSENCDGDRDDEMRFHFLLLALACCDARPLIRMIRDQREFDKVRDRRAAGKSLDG